MKRFVRFLRAVSALCLLLPMVIGPARAFEASALPDLIARGIHERPAPAGSSDAPGYVLFVPPGVRPGAPLLVVVHGAGRKPQLMAEQLAPLAKARGAVVVAPNFDKTRFPEYHVFGQPTENPNEPRSDLGLIAVVDEVATLTGADSAHLLLFGYSGGGQFVHRFTMAHPDRVARFHAASAGWYTWPSRERYFPFGFGSAPKHPGVSLDPAKFLKVPGCVTVGSRDDHPDSQFSTGALLDPEGGNRIERGARWVAAMSRAAGKLDLDTPYVFTIVPEGKHGLEQNMSQGLQPVIDGCLFGDTLAADGPSLR